MEGSNTHTHGHTALFGQRLIGSEKKKACTVLLTFFTLAAIVCSLASKRNQNQTFSVFFSLADVNFAKG